MPASLSSTLEERLGLVASWRGLRIAWFRDWGSALITFLGLYALVFFLWQIFQWGGPERRAAIGDLAFVPVNLAAAVLAWRAAASSRLEPATRRAWGLAGLAFALIWLGDLLFFYDEIIRRIDPFPSLADGPYLLFYPVLLWGLALFPTAPRSRVDRVKFWLDAGTVLLGGWMIIWFFVLGPTARAQESDLLASAISLAYPLGDLVLVLGIATVLLRRPQPESRRALSILTAGIFLFLAGDLAFGYLSLKDAYQSGGWVDSLYMGAQYLMAVSAHFQYSRVSRQADGFAGSRAREEMRDEVSLLPYAAVGLSYLLLAVVGRQEPDYKLSGLLLGAVLLTGLVVLRQLMVLRENTRLVLSLHDLAMTDSLTGLYNRRKFLEVAEREFTRAQRYGRPLCAIMVDIDFFKTINDDHGHDLGDETLRRTAVRARHLLREMDVIGRFGGDEFIIILPETDLAAASAVAHRLQTHLAVPIVTEEGPVMVTASIGVASSEGCAELRTLLRRADAALYRAKQDGRRRTHVFAPV